MDTALVFIITFTIIAMFLWAMQRNFNDLLINKKHKKAGEVPFSYITPDMLVYVAGPYTAKTPDGKEDHEVVGDRMRLFCLCIASLVNLGVKPCSPLYMHFIRGYQNDMPGDWNFWGTYSTVMLQKCDVLLIVKIAGWKESTGVAQEIVIATERNIPIVYMSPEEILSK